MLLDKDILSLHNGLISGEFTIRDLVEESFSLIKKHAGEVNAFITVLDEKSVLKKAEDLQKKLNKNVSPLFGLPYVLKDSYATSGIQTTAASNVLKGFKPTYNATIYQKLEDSGAILVGKMNMDAWGHGGSSENTDFGPVKNPWDISRVAGGSGGGPAVAVSSRMAAFAIGEDTGGSIRNPAAWCGISGLKVTYGRVSRYGCIAYASSFDTVGPTAKSVLDCSIVLETIAGVDPYDATSSPRPVPNYSKLLDSNLHGLTIGWPKEFYSEGLDDEIKNKLAEMAKELEKLGAKIKEISMPLFDFGIPVYYLIGPSETSSNLARYDGVRYGFGRENFTEETKRRIMVGTYALSAGYYDAYYKKAQKARTLFIQEYKKALSECDVLLMPVTPTDPPKIGELMSDHLKNLLADVYTTSQNPVGVPSLAVPCGFSKNNLPIGAQLVGNMFSEELLLRIGYQYQKVTNWHTQKPKLITNS